MAWIGTADVAVQLQEASIEIMTLECAALREQLCSGKTATATRVGQRAAPIRYNVVAVAAIRAHVYQPTYAASPENRAGVRRWPMDVDRALVAVPGIVEEMAKKELRGCPARPAR